MEDLTQAHAEGYASSMLSATVEFEAFVAAYQDCTDFKGIYNALHTSTDISPQYVYPEYCLGQHGLLCFNDGKSIRTCVPSSKRAYILKLMHDLPLGAHLGAAKLKKAVMSSFIFLGCQHILKLMCLLVNIVNVTKIIR